MREFSWVGQYTIEDSGRWWDPIGRYTVCYKGFPLWVTGTIRGARSVIRRDKIRRSRDTYKAMNRKPYKIVHEED